MSEALRKELGEFNSIICLKAVVVGLEEVIGEQGARANLILASGWRERTRLCT